MLKTMSQNPDSKILENFAEKLGYENKIVFRNAEVYLRTLKTKSNVKNISETAKAVLCLDLGATTAGSSIDRDAAIKLSGLKKSSYLNNLHIIEKVLDLDKPLVISELCVQLSCTVVKDLAEQILGKYQEKDEIGRDFTHPQYTAAAVYTACRLKHIKVQKSQLIAVSRLKQTQWKELEQEFLKFAEGCGFGADCKKKSKSNGDFTKYLEENAKSLNALSRKNENCDNDEEEGVEDYDTWKNRVLEEAYKSLKSMK